MFNEDNKKKRIVILNASLHGDSDNSNTFLLLRQAEKYFISSGAEVTIVSPDLINENTYMLSVDKAVKEIDRADGIVVGSGTYWGQSSSVLQKFIEDITPTEGSYLWLAKPMGVIVSEHSTGGQQVLSNIMFTFSNFGCLLPPQSGVVISRTGQEVFDRGGEWVHNIGNLGDIKFMCDNILAYANTKRNNKITSWPVGLTDEKLNYRWVK